MTNNSALTPQSPPNHKYLSRLTTFAIPISKSLSRSLKFYPDFCIYGKVACRCPITNEKIVWGPTNKTWQKKSLLSLLAWPTSVHKTIGKKINISYEVKFVLFENKTLEILCLPNFISLLYHCEKVALYIFICLWRIDMYIP